MALHLPDKLVEREIDAICKRYRISAEAARKVFDECIQRRPDLLRKILSKRPEQDITRLKAYKTFIKDVRKHIYYYLRQYQPEKDSTDHLRQQLAALITASAPSSEISSVIRELLRTHVSTHERLAHYQDFYETLFAHIARPTTILDIGCGLHPLSYPHRPEDSAESSAEEEVVAGAPSTQEIYVAIDKQPDIIETLRIFAPLARPTRLVPVCADIADIHWPTYMDDAGVDMFDVALMLKFIPVIARQQRRLLAALAAIPARRMLVTATTEAMTRKQNIRKREERILREFIESTARQVCATFQVGSEFGFLLDLPGTRRAQKFS